MALLSIVVPVYNVRDYIEQCVLSILQQDYREIEVIIVDDGSTDGSSIICDELSYRDDRIKIIHQENMGMSGARNTGLKNVHGDYIGFIDSDDWIEDKMFSMMVNEMQSEGADIVMCRNQHISSEGVIYGIEGYSKRMILNNVQATEEILRDINIHSYVWNKIYKRDLLCEFEFPVGRIYEDTASLFKLFFKARKVISIPYIGYNYRVRHSSICHIDINNDLNIKRELDNVFAFYSRYKFVKVHPELDGVLPVCAKKVYTMLRNFLHKIEYEKNRLSNEQEKDVRSMLNGIIIADLSMFSLFERMDILLSRISYYLLILYLKVISVIRSL